MLLMAYDTDGKIFNASVCGDNCAKWILKLGGGEIFFVTIQIHAKFRKNRESCLREGVLFLNRFYSCRIFFLHVTFLYSKIKSVVCNSSEPNGENFASSLQE